MLFLPMCVVGSWCHVVLDRIQARTYLRQQKYTYITLSRDNAPEPMQKDLVKDFVWVDGEGRRLDETQVRHVVFARTRAMHSNIHTVMHSYLHSYTHICHRNHCHHLGAVVALGWLFVSICVNCLYNRW
jgi:hypothetical protein